MTSSYFLTLNYFSANLTLIDVVGLDPLLLTSANFSYSEDGSPLNLYSDTSNYGNDLNNGDLNP